MSLEEASNDDVVTDVEGVKFVIDKDLDNSFENIKVDYGNSGFRKGFMISLENDHGGHCN